VCCAGTQVEDKREKMLAAPHRKLEEVGSTQSKGKVVARDLKVVDFLMGI